MRTPLDLLLDKYSSYMIMSQSSFILYIHDSMPFYKSDLEVGSGSTKHT